MRSHPSRLVLPPPPPPLDQKQPQKGTKSTLGFILFPVHRSMCMFTGAHTSRHPPPTCTHRKDVGSLWVNVFTSHLSSAPKNSKQRDLWYQTHPQFHHFCHVNRNIYSNTILYTYCMYWKGLSHFEAPLCRHNEGKPHPVESNLGHRRCKALMKWWVFSLCLYWYQC